MSFIYSFCLTCLNYFFFSCAPIEEPFFKVPRDSLISMSSSSSGSSTGLFPNQSKCNYELMLMF